MAETIARYPAGTIVTVYYNPRNPREAVLERDLPKGLWGCLGIGTAIAVAVVFGSAIGLNACRNISVRISPIRRCRCRLWRWRASAWSRRLFALVLRRQSALAESWPVVAGQIKLSGLDEYRAAPSDSGRRGATMYERKVSYGYSFNGVAYSGVHASFSSNIQNDIALGAAAVRDGFSGRRQRQGLGQSRQSVGGDAQSSRRHSAGCYG